MKSKVFMCLFALASLMGYSQTNSLAKASSQSHFDLSILNAQNSGAPFSPIALETLENSTTPSLLPIDCGFSTPSNNFQDGIGYLQSDIIASDFKAQAGTTFSAKKLIFNVFQTKPTEKVEVSFYQNNNEKPGHLIARTAPLVPTSMTDLDIVNGSFVVRIEVDLPQAVALTAGDEATTYWVGLQVQNAGRTYWETTTIINSDFTYHTSYDGGSTWTSGENLDNVFDLIGECYDNPEGCTESPNGQFPATVFTSACYGFTQLVAENASYGEYSTIEVTAGTQYIFKTNHDTDFITITDNAGNVVYRTGYGSAVWVATFSGNVRFYTHENDECSISEELVNRYVQCGDLVFVLVPDFTCFQGDGLVSITPENAFGTQGNERIADDFIVLTDEILHSFTQAPTLVRVLSNGMMGMRIHELTVDFEQEMTFEAGKYWIVPMVHDQTESASLYWEATTDGFSGSFAAWSENEGQTWVENPIGMRMIFFVSGECEDMNVADPKIAEFDYYPNPTKDKLYMKSKSKIEKVSVYNSLGQLVINQTKVQQNQIDLSQLNAGVYLFRVLLENGQVETFKIVKL